MRPAKATLRAKAPCTAVFLVGFMGAGKSSVGRVLGERLHWVFEDLDDRIEQREHRTVAQIFSDSGEAAFRTAEALALQDVLDQVRSGVSRIIALGGGAFAQKANASRIAAAGVPTVFLEAPVVELWERCRKQAERSGTVRPLLQDLDQFRRLYQSRRASYRKAAHRIETAGRAVEEIAAEIERLLELKSIAIRTEQGEVE